MVSLVHAGRLECEGIGGGCSWLGACLTRLPAGHRLGQGYSLSVFFTLHVCLVCWLLDSWTGVHIVDAALSLCTAPIRGEALTQPPSQPSDLQQPSPSTTKSKHLNMFLDKGFVPLETSVHAGSMPISYMSCVHARLGQGDGATYINTELLLDHLPTTAQVELGADHQLEECTLIAVHASKMCTCCCWGFAA